MKSMVTAINHVTLAVQDLDRLFSFYTGNIGLHPVARWYKGAYLVAGSDWICLSLDPAARNAPLPEYTHLAFTVPAEEFGDAVTRLQDAGVTFAQAASTQHIEHAFVEQEAFDMPWKESLGVDADYLRRLKA